MAYQPTPPAPQRRKRRLWPVLLLVVILGLGGTVAFATIGAQAAVPAPAALVVFTPSVELKHAAGA